MIAVTRLAIYACVWLTTLGWSHSAEAQSLTVSTFPAAYRQAEDKLYHKYAFNRKVVYTATSPHFIGRDGKPTATLKTVAVCGENASRRITFDDSKPDLAYSAEMGYRGEVYVMRVSDQPGGYSIRERRIPNDGGATRYGAAMSVTMPNMYPLMYMGATGQTTMGAVLTLAEGARPGAPKFKLLSVRTADFHGLPAVEASFVGLMDIVDKIYLDPSNDLAFLGSESDGSYDPKTRNKGPVRVSTRVTYRPSDEGFPIPAQFDLWETSPGGKPISKGHVDVLEYEKYTPTADDFDLEKQFGVKPLPLPGETPPASRRWLWLYAAAGLLAVFTAALVVIARRKRRASRSNS